MVGQGGDDGWHEGGQLWDDVNTKGVTDLSDTQQGARGHLQPAGSTPEHTHTRLQHLHGKHGM